MKVRIAMFKNVLRPNWTPMVFSFEPPSNEFIQASDWVEVEMPMYPEAEVAEKVKRLAEGRLEELSRQLEETRRSMLETLQ